MILSGRYVFLFSCCLFLFPACKSVSYFYTSNDLVRQNGTVYLENGTEKSGDITIAFETGHSSKDFINLFANGKTERVPTKDIKGYKLKDKYYVPRYIDLDGNGSNYLLFVQRLTKEDSRIGLYELYQRGQGSNAKVEDLYSYYISVPNHSKFEVWNASGKYLVPRFDEKMSKIVADCPALAQKIQQQEKGYFYAKLTLSDQKKADVLKRIIDEYNDCK